MKLKIKKLKEDAIIPTRSNPTDSGLDLYACINEDIILHPKQQVMVDTGIAIELPEKTTVKVDGSRKNILEWSFESVDLIWEAQIRPRSGLAMKHGITIVNSPGTVDNSYRGPIKVILYNLSQDIFKIENGMRIAQMIIVPVVIPDIEIVDEITDTDRGKDGFGSTGK